MFTRRRLTPEMMDDPSADPEELASSLGWIELVNTWLGGSRASLGVIKAWSRRWPAGETIRIIDLGTGAADIPLELAKWAASAGLKLHITGDDLHETTLALARDRIGSRNDIDLVHGDALCLMNRFEPGSFDYAHASLFLHHLPDIEVITTLRIMDRLARRGMLWNDLRRSAPALLAVRGLSALGGLPCISVPRMARHDAVVSVEAGFTRAEALELASRAGWGEAALSSEKDGCRFRSHLHYRFTLACSKRGGGPAIGGGIS